MACTCLQYVFTLEDASSNCGGGQVVIVVDQTGDYTWSGSHVDLGTVTLTGFPGAGSPYWQLTDGGNLDAYVTLTGECPPTTGWSSVGYCYNTVASVVANCAGTPPAAALVGIDTRTQGGWPEGYGREGFQINAVTAALPGYATLTFTGTTDHTWAASGTTTDARAPLVSKDPYANRIASCWTASASFTVRIQIADGGAKDVAFYLLDWDQSGGTHQATVDARETGDGTVLGTQSLTNYVGGTWVKFKVAGDSTFTFTKTAGGNVTLSGVFFGTDPFFHRDAGGMMM